MLKLLRIKREMSPFQKILRISLGTLCIALITGCSLTAPKPDLCGIVSIDNKTVLECIPTDERRTSYIIHDLDVDGLGFTCLSPRDRGEIKKFLKQAIKKLDEIE